MSTTTEYTLSDAEALDILRTMTGHSFACSLVEQWDRKRYLSGRQWPWVHRLASEEMVRQEEAKKVTNAVEAIVTDESQMDGIFALFSAAQQHLTFPKIRLAIEDGEGIRHYRLAVAGGRSRYPGSLSVTFGSGEEREFIGRISTDGLLIPTTADFTVRHPGLVELLVELAKDPERVAREYGRLVGSCCFCGISLTDERSTAAGYGPICAKRYNLAWG